MEEVREHPAYWNLTAGGIASTSSGRSRVWPVESLTLTARAAALVRNNGGRALASYAPASWVSLAFQLSHLPPASARVLAVGHSHRRRYLFPMRGESAIVVEDRKELTYLLCQAAELEHAVMCEYLYAAFSLKSTAGPGVRDDQLEVIERWRQVLLDIAREEMLHWAVVQNLLTAVGSAPYVSRRHMPHQAKGYPPGVQFRLLPFGEAALQHFVYFERPEGVDRADAEGFDLAGPPLLPMRPEEIVPRGQDFATQGHLYRSVESGFAHLADKLGEGRYSSAWRFQQADETAFGWPDLGPITDLEGANRALERIVEQGEGATGTGQLPITATSSTCSMTTWRCARRIRASSQPTRPSRRHARGRGNRARRLHHRPHHRRLLRPVQRRL